MASLLDKAKYLDKALNEVAIALESYGAECYHTEEGKIVKEMLHTWKEKIEQMSLPAEKIVIKDYGDGEEITLDETAILIPMTQAQYDALTEKDSDVYYFITD